MSQPAPRHQQCPLVVDLDGTFLLTDTLVEGVVDAVATRSQKLVPLLWALGKGRAPFKRAVSENSAVDYASLPVREPLLAFLKAQHEIGRPLHLVSAADQNIVDQFAAAYPIFETATGSDGVINLKGQTKLNYLARTFPNGFSYAGDSAADLAVWRGAQSIVLAGCTKAIAKKAAALGVPVEASFDIGGTSAKIWIKALRLHQWAKNFLLFIPALLSISDTPLVTLVMCILGFLVLGVAASGTYLINDLADLASDRHHRTKKLRPFASGALPLGSGLIAAPLMLIAALSAAFALSPGFFGMVMLYLAITLSYSFSLKRVALLDAVILAVLYTLRLFMGMVLIGVGSSPWLLAFASFFFFSMSLAKRQVELLGASGPAHEQISGRGYRPSDWPLTLALGTASSVASILIMIQYLMAEAFPSSTYSYPTALWMAPFLIGLWTCRIWLLAQRGELEDDPVAFATKDPQSLILGVVLGASFLAARFV